ncbi:MAG TPA: hypothetical protein VKF16_04030 [Candidatus Dormibacteraeota bacterium]|nr:hypothetical protein [Candidatus Dormibacteraeota bacterium]
MNRVLGLSLAALLAVGVLVAIVASYVLGHHTPAASLITVRGVIGSEKQPYFQDADVIKVFHDHGYDVQVDVAGSRQIATTVDLSKYDFAFPAGVPQANKIKADHKAKATYSPFYTPMAIASFKTIADLLVQAGVVTNQGGAYLLDVNAYLKLVAANKRWTDLPNNTTYPAGKSILITSTDVRTSNSAAMYLALTSYVANGNNVVQDAQQAQTVLPLVSPLFLRQGLTETSSEVPFNDYLSIGIGKSPMVMIYEAQFVARETAKDGSITAQNVLMYPSPTVLSKHTLVPLTPHGDAIGQLLLNDPQLQKLAVKYGFRTSDPTAFKSYLDSKQVPQPPQLINVIEPPAYDPLEAMISGIEKEMNLLKAQGG